MYGHWATPQPMTMLATAPMARSARPVGGVAHAAARASAVPQTAETMTKGSARDVSPSKT